MKGIDISSNKNGRPTRVSDNLTRMEMLEVFNRHEIFVSYDSETAASVIAALCGCLSIIVPREGHKKEDLLPCFHFGIAYGLDDLSSAMVSRSRLGEFITRIQEDADATVVRFTEITRRQHVWR